METVCPFSGGQLKMIYFSRVRNGNFKVTLADRDFHNLLPLSGLLIIFIHYIFPAPIPENPYIIKEQLTFRISSSNQLLCHCMRFLFANLN